MKLVNYQFLRVPIICTVLIFSCFPKVFAQKKAAATTSGSGAKTTASSSTGATYVSGFAYILPENYHLEYKTTKKQTMRTIMIANPGGVYDQITIDTVDYTYWSFAPQAGSNYHLQPIVLNYPVFFPGWSQPKKIMYYGYVRRIDTTVCKVQPPTCCTPAIDGVPGTVFKHTWIDTIDRFKRGGHLRVSVTPGDSGRLAVVVKPQLFQTPPVIEDSHFARYTPGNVISAAIPLSQTDSANSTFLMVTPNNFVGEKPYYAPLHYTIIQYGAVTIPFKYRFNNSRPIGGTSNPKDATKAYESGINAPSESTASINVAAYVGKKFGGTNFYYDPNNTYNSVSGMIGAFIGPSLIALSANNVNNGTDMNAVPSNQLAISTGAALTMEWRTVNFGFFYGWDVPVERSPWVYRYKGWIGFGIGFSLGMFSNTNAKAVINGN